MALMFSEGKMGFDSVIDVKKIANLQFWVMLH